MRNFEGFQREVLRHIGARQDPGTVEFVKGYINEGFQEVWNAHPWDWKAKRLRTQTVASVSTGTVTVSNGGTAVTGVGTPFTSAMEGRKFAKSIGTPWNYIEDVASATALTLTDDWLEDSLAASTFIIFQDEYELDADVDEVTSVRLLTGTRPALRRIGLDKLERYQNVSSATGTPLYWYEAPKNSTTSNVVIGFWPVPSTAMAIEIRYNPVCPELIEDDDFMVMMPVDFEPLVIAYALEQAANFGFLENKSIISAQRYEKLLQRKINQYTSVDTPELAFEAFDESGYPPGPYPFWDRDNE